MEMFSQLKFLEWPVYVLAAYAGACRPITTFDSSQRRKIEDAVGIKSAKPYDSVCRFRYCGKDHFMYFSPEDGKAAKLPLAVEGIKALDLNAQNLLNSVSPACLVDTAPDIFAAGGTQAANVIAWLVSTVMKAAEALTQAPKGVSVLMGNVELSYDRYRTTYGAAVHYFMCRHIGKEDEFRKDPGLCLALASVGVFEKDQNPAVESDVTLPLCNGFADYLPVALGMAARFGALISKFLS